MGITFPQNLRKFFFLYVQKQFIQKHISGPCTWCVHFLFKRVCGRGAIPGVHFYIGPNPRTKNILGLRISSKNSYEIQFNAFCNWVRLAQIRSDRPGWARTGQTFFFVRGFWQVSRGSRCRIIFGRPHQMFFVRPKNLGRTTPKSFRQI